MINDKLYHDYKYIENLDPVTNILNCYDKYLNSKNLIDCDEADKIIKDDEHIFGEMKLYIQDEKNPEFHLSVAAVKKALSELYNI
jgi:hypothetical protein